MNNFRSIEDLIQSLEREKVLLKEMFAKRKSLSFRFDDALELVEYKEDRIRRLIECGVICESGNFLELEDVYLKFFEEVLEVNEEINVSYIQDYLTRLNENIEYWLKENNEKRKYGYYREVQRCLRSIALTTIRNVVDLKRNMDNTYKNEPNYLIKRDKLENLNTKIKHIRQLIASCERLIDEEQPMFFKKACDVQMRNTVNDVKLQLQDSAHNLIDIQGQIIHYIGLVEYQSKIFEKVRKLKYLKDQFLLKEQSDIQKVMSEKNPVWLEPQTYFKLKLSVEDLRNSPEALEIIRKIASRQNADHKMTINTAPSIPDDFLQQQEQPMHVVNLREIFNAFSASGAHLFEFVMNYNWHDETSDEQKLVYFCQIASQFSDNLNFTDDYARREDIVYPIILPR